MEAEKDGLAETTEEGERLENTATEALMATQWGLVHTEDSDKACKVAKTVGRVVKKAVTADSGG